VQPIDLVINGKKCTWGYNYDVELEYIITFTGPNAPKMLYTLQGTINSGTASLFFKLPKKPGSGETETHSNAWRSQSDCATATIATMNFQTISIQIEGDGISARTISFAFASVLPVNMASFTAREEQQKIKLNWQTATENNNDFFTVERSANNGAWTAIKKIKGAGNSVDLRSYEAYDEFPVAGTSNYRIKQTDFNGNSSYSEVRTVEYAVATRNISLYPIPNAGNTITIAGISGFKNHELAVLNTGGNKVFATTLSNASVELPSLVKGIYFIRISNKHTGESTTFRYVKL
jgi:hypothetical protein